MPIKLKPSQTVRDKKTGKLTTEHFYIKNCSDDELRKLIMDEGTKKKLRIKCIREVFRRDGWRLKKS